MNSREESLDIIFDGNLIPRVNIELNGKPVSFIVDTGCEWSAITKKQLKDLESTEDKIIADT